MIILYLNSRFEGNFDRLWFVHFEPGPNQRRGHLPRFDRIMDQKSNEQLDGVVRKRHVHANEQRQQRLGHVEVAPVKTAVVAQLHQLADQFIVGSGKKLYIFSKII